MSVCQRSGFIEVHFGFDYNFLIRLDFLVYFKNLVARLYPAQMNRFNPFHLIGIFLYHLKTSKNLWFYVFRGNGWRPVAWNRLTETKFSSETQPCHSTCFFSLLCYVFRNASITLTSVPYSNYMKKTNGVKLPFCTWSICWVKNVREAR